MKAEFKDKKPIRRKSCVQFKCKFVDYFSEQASFVSTKISLLIYAVK